MLELGAHDQLYASINTHEMSKIAAYNCRAEEEPKFDIHAPLLDYDKTCILDKHTALAYTSRMTELSGQITV